MRKKSTDQLSDKYLFIFFTLLFLTSTGLYATNHVIKFGGTLGLNYSPSELNVAVGDTVTWEGTFSSHPLSSTSVPQDAASFNKGSGSTFSYLVHVPGNYNYECDFHTSSGMTGSFSAIISSVEENVPWAQPGIFRLNQNYPNPFNPTTVISWQLAVDSNVKLTVYNLLGEMVATLVSERMNSGNHTYPFDGKNLTSGVYYYQLVAGNYREVKRMILIK
jgi:plastocyanin